MGTWSLFDNLDVEGKRYLLPPLTIEAEMTLLKRRYWALKQARS